MERRVLSPLPPKFLRMKCSHVLNVLSFAVIAVQICTAISIGQHEVRPRYDVRIALSSKACIRCCSALLSAKREHLGVLGSQLSITVQSQHVRILKQVREMVADTNLVRVELVTTPTTPLDSIVVLMQGAKQSRTSFSLEHESLKVLPFLDSLDAMHTAIVVDTSTSDVTVQLRSRLMFDEASRVHVHDDHVTVSVAGNDRAMIVRADTARVLPQYLYGMDSAQRARMMMPTRTVVMSPTHVRYRFVVPTTSIDTVINGEVAKLFTSVDAWVSDVHTTPAVRNDLHLQSADESTLGEWTSSDSTIVVVPDTSGPNDPVPTQFVFAGYPVDIPARFFPTVVSLCDARGDTIYSCSPSDGWIRITKPASLLHMPPPTRVARELVLARCITTSGGVLLTAYDAANAERYCSILLGANGARISPVVWHVASTIVVPTVRNGRTTIETIRRTDAALHRSIVWQGNP